MTTFAVPTSIIEPQPAAVARPAFASTPVSTEHLLRARRRLPARHPDRDVLRTRAIEDNLPLANQLARRYAGRGEGFDDLKQVAALALVKAVDGYDPDRHEPFAGYAVPTIVGALKRHFRDTAWGMRVPRSTQELVLALPVVRAHLTQLRGRTPTLAEVADHLRVTIDVLLAAVSASQVYRLPSLNAPPVGNDDVELIDLIGAADPRYDDVDDHLALGPLIAALPAREQRILTMRFYDEMSQSRIAAELGLSQMHVSRILRRSLNRLKAALLKPDQERAAQARR